MSTCTLRVSGICFDVKKFLGKSAFDCTDVWEKGEPPIAIPQLTTGIAGATNPKIPPCKDSGFLVLLSETEEPNSIEKCVKEAEAFLQAQHASLLSLCEDSSVESIELQFAFFSPVGSDFNSPMSKMLFLSKEFLKLVGSFKMSLEVTVYNSEMLGGADS